MLVAETITRVSAAQAELVRRYFAGVRLEGRVQTQEQALLDLREVCRLIGELQLISYTSIAALAAIPASSPTAAKRRRRVVRRLIKLLQNSGELPTLRELNASKAIEQTIAATPLEGRRTLRSWLAQRRHTVGWWDLRFEAERLYQMELVIAAHPEADDQEWITRWLIAIVRQIVKCDCPPVTRSRNHDVCSTCGKTSASHGTRPSPGERKQHEYSVAARRYLEYRRLTTSGRSG